MSARQDAYKLTDVVESQTILSWGWGFGWIKPYYRGCKRLILWGLQLTLLYLFILLTSHGLTFVQTSLTKLKVYSFNYVLDLISDDFDSRFIELGMDNSGKLTLKTGAALTGHWKSLDKAELLKELQAMKEVLVWNINRREMLEVKQQGLRDYLLQSLNDEHFEDGEKT